VRVGEVNHDFIASLGLLPLPHSLLGPLASDQLNEVELAGQVESFIAAVLAPVAGGLGDEAEVDDLGSVDLLVLSLEDGEVDSLFG
jgi:hypothetical protein